MRLHLQFTVDAPEGTVPEDLRDEIAAALTEKGASVVNRAVNRDERSFEVYGVFRDTDERWSSEVVAQDQAEAETKAAAESDTRGERVVAVVMPR